MTASSSGCTPLFLKDAPQRIGKSFMLIVPLRTAAFSSAGVIGSPCTYFSIRCLSTSASPSIIVVRPHQPDLVDQVDEPAVLVLAADRDLHRNRMGAQALTHQVDALEEVRP